MKRRRFFHESLKWGLRVFMAGMLPGIPGCSEPNLSSGAAYGRERFNGLSLREVSRRKLHHGNGRFISPFTAIDYDGRLPEVLKWKLTPSKFKHLFPQEKRVPVEIDWSAILHDTGLSITYLNHASILIQDQGIRILVDPIFFGLSFFIKDFTPLIFKDRSLPVMDHILITHGHYDHLDKKTLGTIAKGSHVISPLGYADLMKECGFSNRTELDWYDAFKNESLDITLLPCHHWTMRNPIVGANRSLWGSYLLKTKTGPTIYLAGDTAYFEEIREIGEEFDIDLAILNLGAYEPRWMMSNSHMSPQEAIKAIWELKARHFMIVHWGTFRLGDEPVFLPPDQLKAELKSEGKTNGFIPIHHGQTIHYDGLMKPGVNQAPTLPAGKSRT